MKYMFMQDDGCHWYLVPESMTSMFVTLLDNAQADDYVNFCSTFDDYRCGHPTNYTLENPEYR